MDLTKTFKYPQLRKQLTEMPVEHYLRQLVQARLLLLTAWENDYHPKYPDPYITNQDWKNLAIIETHHYPQEIVRRVVKFYRNRGFRLNKAFRQRWVSASKPQEKIPVIVIFHGPIPDSLKDKIDLNNVYVY